MLCHASKKMERQEGVAPSKTSLEEKALTARVTDARLVETKGFAPSLDYVQGRCRAELATFPKLENGARSRCCAAQLTVLRTGGFAGSLNVR